MINKLCKLICDIPKDKILHYFIAYIIIDICFSTLCHFNISILFNVLISFDVATVAIFGKEILDEKLYNGWCWFDILAGYLGVISKICVIVIEKL